MKQAIVFLRNIKAGILTEDENGYTFQYDAMSYPLVFSAQQKICQMNNSYPVNISSGRRMDIKEEYNDDYGTEF